MAYETANYRVRDFVEEMRFDRLGVFTYSEEEGNLAADLKDDITERQRTPGRMRSLRFSMASA